MAVVKYCELPRLKVPDVVELLLSLVLLSVVVFIFFLAGALSGNVRMIGSNLPFLVLAGVFFRLILREKQNKVKS